MKTPLADKAALAIINSVANPALSTETRNCTANNLARIIAEHTAADDMLQALQKAFDMMAQYDNLVHENTLDEEDEYEEWSKVFFLLRDILAKAGAA